MNYDTLYSALFPCVQQQIKPKFMIENAQNVGI